MLPYVFVAGLHCTRVEQRESATASLNNCKCHFDMESEGPIGCTFEVKEGWIESSAAKEEMKNKKNKKNKCK